MLNSPDPESTDVISHLTLALDPEGKAPLTAADPDEPKLLFIVIPEDRVSKTKEIADPDAPILAVAGVKEPEATLVTNNDSPPCSK
jgi:hypothetical protein